MIYFAVPYARPKSRLGQTETPEISLPEKLTFLRHFEDMLAKELSKFVGWVAPEMNVLACPEFLVEGVLVILDELPLVANGDLGVLLHDLEGPGVEEFLHYPCRPARRPAFFAHVAGGRKTVGNGTGSHPDQLGLGLLELGDDLFQVCLIADLVVVAVPMSMIETDDVPVPTGLTVRPQPFQDAGPTLCRSPAVGGRVMQVELAREKFPQALVVVPRDRITDKKVARKLGVIGSGLIAYRLKMYLAGMNHFPFSLAHDAGPVDEGFAILGSQNVEEQGTGLPAFLEGTFVFFPIDGQGARLGGRIPKPDEAQIIS